MSRVCTGLFGICLLENTHNLGIKFREFERQHRPVRMKNEVTACRQQANMVPQHIAQPALDAIAFVSLAEDLANGESDARDRRLGLRSQNQLIEAERCLRPSA